MSNTDLFAALLAENFRGVSYDEKKQSGRASIPTVGTIEFREASNDPAVIINFTSTKRFKGSAESAAKFLEALHEAWINSD